MSPEDKHKLEAAERTLKATEAKIEKAMRDLSWLFESRKLLKKSVEHMKSKQARSIKDASSIPAKT